MRSSLCLGRKEHMWTGCRLGFTPPEASNKGQQCLATHFTVLSFTRDFLERKEKGKESTHTSHETFFCFCLRNAPSPRPVSLLLLRTRRLNCFHTQSKTGSRTVSDLFSTGDLLCPRQSRHVYRVLPPLFPCPATRRDLT